MMLNMRVSPVPDWRQSGQPGPFTPFHTGRQVRSFPLPAAFPKHCGMRFPVM